MSGIIVNNVARASGTIAATPGGLDWSTAVVTASTVTVEAGRGYFINTTSNACTITLPASAETGDQIVIADYARTWATNNVTIDSNGLTFQGSTDAFTVKYTTVGQSLNIVYSDSTKGWLPVSDDAVADVPVTPSVQRAIFAFGTTGGTSFQNISNLVNASGVVGSDVTGVGTARKEIMGCGYGGDKAIFAFGKNAGYLNLSNLVSNSGVVASDGTGVGTERETVGAASYGLDKGIFCFGWLGSRTGVSNLVSNSGVVASDTAAVATAKAYHSGCPYGGDKAIMAYGHTGSAVNTKNLISNSGVVASDASGVGTTRTAAGATSFNAKQEGVFAFGDGPLSTKNLISNTGVQAADSSTSGTARYSAAAAPYGGDKAIFAYGHDGSSGFINTSNLVSNSGVVGSDVTGVGTARYQLGGSGYGFS